MTLFKKDSKGWGEREQFDSWNLLVLPLFEVRLHHMFEPDKPEFYHSHPRSFISIMLWGSYLEKIENKCPTWRSVGMIGRRAADCYHYAWHPHGKSSWSLVFFFGRKEPWYKAELEVG